MPVGPPIPVLDHQILTLSLSGYRPGSSPDRVNICTGMSLPMLTGCHLPYKDQIERREAAQLKKRAGVVPATRPTTPIWHSYIPHEPANFDRNSRAQFAKSPTAQPSGAARSSRRGRRAIGRGRRARRGGCRLVTLSPSFMPRLLTRVPPLLSDLVPCDTGRRRCRRDIRRCRRQGRSGHRRRCRGRRGCRRRWWFLAACGDECQSGRDHQRFS